MGVLSLKRSICSDKFLVLLSVDNNYCYFLNKFQGCNLKFNQKLKEVQICKSVYVYV